MLNLLIVFVSLSTIAAFSTNSVKHSPTTTLYARSKSVPFAEQPAALTGQYPGDVGFDPLGLSNIFPDVRSSSFSTLCNASVYRSIGENLLFPNSGKNHYQEERSQLLSGCENLKSSMVVSPC